MRRICLDFFGIPMHKNKYKVELDDGIIVKLFMRISSSFVGHNRLESEIENNLPDCVTIISAQRETSSMIFGIHGEADDIWSLHQIVALPFKCDNVFYVRQVWSNGDDELFAKMTHDSMMNGGQVPDNSVHQMFLFQRIIFTGTDKAPISSNRVASQFNITPRPGHGGGRGCSYLGGGGGGGLGQQHQAAATAASAAAAAAAADAAAAAAAATATATAATAATAKPTAWSEPSACC